MPRTRRRTQRHPEARRVRRLRDTLGLTQRELAAEFHVAHGAIAAWETGAKTIPGPVLKLLELYEEELGIGQDDRGIVQLKTSMLSRNAALSRTAASAFTRGAAAWLEGMLAGDARKNAITSRAHAAIARNLVTTLGELKGVAMKVGQTLSYLDHTLPLAARTEFATLETSSRPMSPTAIAQVFLEEFGEPPRRLFAEWSTTPFAAASIGQVHRARLRSGEEVAVKVQYPAVIDAINADLAASTVFEHLARLLFRGQEDGAFMSEIKERFREECNYQQEAENQLEFRRLWRGRPGLRIPRVFEDFTRPRVLVTELERGEHVDTFARHASQAARDRAGETLWQFAYESAFRHGMFHADPHAGNYLFDGGDVVVLDFGSVKRLSDDILSLWQHALRGLLERNRDVLSDVMVRLGMVRNPDHYDFAYDFGMLLGFYEAWLRDAPFTFTPQFAEHVWRIALLDNPNKFRINTPKDWFLVDRMQFGLYSLLGRLGASANIRRRALDLLYEADEPRPAPFSDGELGLIPTLPSTN